MPRKKNNADQQMPANRASEANPQLIKLEDLIPRKDVAGGKRLLFGAVNYQTKKQKD